MVYQKKTNKIYKKIMPHFCKQCGKEFKPKRIDNHHKGYFCSRECASDYKKANRLVKICETCGNSYNALNGSQRFCSRKCVSMAGDKNPSWKGGKEELTCVVCGCLFYRSPSMKSKTCSRACAGERQSVNNIGEHNPNSKPIVIKGCAACGKEMRLSPSRLNVLYCSYGCFVRESFSRNSARWSSKSRWGATSSKTGIRPDLGIYVRSSWEANYARYLNYLTQLKIIKSWEYEKETFEFPVKRGTRFYTPDFKVINKDGVIEYHEVKGYMTQKGATALKRMKLYYPDIKVVLIEKPQYNEIKQKLGRLIKEWE